MPESLWRARMIIEKYLVEPRHIEVRFFRSAGSWGCCSTATAQYSAATRKSLKKRLLLAFPTPLARQWPDARTRLWTRHRLCRRRHHRVSRRPRAAILFHGNEHPSANGTGHQNDHRHRSGRVAIACRRWQKYLPLTQDQIQIHGHASKPDSMRKIQRSISCLVPGRLNHLRFLDWRMLPGLRIDSGVQEGNVISTWFPDDCKTDFPWPKP